MTRSRKHIASCGMVAKDRGAKKRFNRRIRRLHLDDCSAGRATFGA